jgi:azurin
MYDEFDTSDDVILWLKARSKNNIRVASNPMKLVLCFVDIDSGDHIKFKVREAKDKRIAKACHKLQKFPIEGGAMFQDWLNNIL